jgi:DNA gyrase inhibitor GyrI
LICLAAFAGGAPATAPPVASYHSLGPVAVDTIPAVTVLMLSRTGSYAQTGAAINELMAYVMPKGIIRGGPFGIYYDDPAEVAPDSLRWAVCVPVAAGSAAEEPFVLTELPAVAAAAALCTGPYSGMGSCFQELGQWIADQGYIIDGPAREHWLSNPQVVAAAELTSRVLFPVRRP